MIVVGVVWEVDGTEGSLGFSFSASLDTCFSMVEDIRSEPVSSRSVTWADDDGPRHGTSFRRSLVRKEGERVDFCFEGLDEEAFCFSLVVVSEDMFAFRRVSVSFTVPAIVVDSEPLSLSPSAATAAASGWDGELAGTCPLPDADLLVLL